MINGSNSRALTIPIIMILTKYAQSCFLVEAGGGESEKKGQKSGRTGILIDPGSYVPKETVAAFRDIDVVLYTHIHNDHCYPEYLKTILNNNRPLVLTNAEVAQKLKGFSVMVMEDGEKRAVDGVQIKMVKAVHGYRPGMDNYPQQANGFIISDLVSEGKTSVYHCGDTIAFPHDYKADVVLVPVCGHAVVMEPDIAVDFCLKMKATLTIPMHYDSDNHPKGTERFEKYAQEKGLKYRVLRPGEEVEV